MSFRESRALPALGTQRIGSAAGLIASRKSVQNTSLGISTYRKILEAKKRLRRLEPLVLSREKNMCQRLCRREVYIMLSSTRKGNVSRRSYKNTLKTEKTACTRCTPKIWVLQKIKIQCVLYLLVHLRNIFLLEKT